MVGPQTERISQVKKELMHAFQMQDMGAATYFLGVRIVRNRAERSITLIQDAYIEKILTKYSMQDAKPSSTPMQLGALNLMVTNPNQATKGDIEEYQSKMGSITYLAIQTRSDIAFECSVLSRFLTNPSQNHINAANWLLRYIKGTQELGVQYGGKALANNTGTLHGYSDSDFAGDIELRRSTSGFVFFFVGGVISCQSKRQSVTALSSTEAEYYALCKATQEAA